MDLTSVTSDIRPHTTRRWIYDGEQMVQRRVTYVPGFYAIFDGLLVTIAHSKLRSSKMDSLAVGIHGDSVSIYVNGIHIPVVYDAKEKVYTPEHLFGKLQSEEKSDEEKLFNWNWMVIANMFSTVFTVETAQKRTKFKQVFSHNMRTREQPKFSGARESENWMKITFTPDFAKFGMTCLDGDILALMKTRVVDVAGCFGNVLNVKLNGERMKFKSFADYCELFLKASGSEKLPKIDDRLDNGWHVCVSLSNGTFEQVSFVNGLATINGGTHVIQVTKRLTSHLLRAIHSKKKISIDVRPQNIRAHFWIFVNAMIDNPVFDTQRKEALTLSEESFGSWGFKQKFLDKFSKSKIVKEIEQWAEFQDLKTTDGSKGKRALVAKHSEAYQWAKKEAQECTLILTEGDSAKALANAGVTAVGRRHYGVFPLSGQLPNVREANHSQIMQSVEFAQIKQILGLQQGVEYDDAKSLNYGHVMIMTSQDHNGFHNKGLLINLFHYFWPSLLKVPGFLQEFRTPIVKAKHKDGIRKEAFYTMTQYENWKKKLGNDAENWTIKYYQGLGTTTDEEAEEYFRDIEKHKKNFVWLSDDDSEAIKIAFSKKKIEERKSWIQQSDPRKFIDAADKHITCQDFVDKELIMFSISDLQRAIPSIVDGLKPGQRKVLFCSFKTNFVMEAKVSDFCGSVIQHSAYHHGEEILASTIIGMAQDYVGSNNINLLLPIGQFGTRHQGGKDHAIPRYIYTQLAPVTRLLFPKADDILLNYLVEDGRSIEPTWYMPIIPMVLVNGCEGIGSGWSTCVPSYNPLAIIKNIRRLLNGEKPMEMHPWYKGFVGSIVKEGRTYHICGKIEEADENVLRVIELPLWKWTQDYKDFLVSVSATNDKSIDPFIEGFCDNSNNHIVDIWISMSEEKLLADKKDGLPKKLKLSTSISTKNMHLFDSQGRIKKYETPKEILEEFYYLRLAFYRKRQKSELAILKKEILKCNNKCRFMEGVVGGSIIVSNRKWADVCLELKENGFTPFPDKEKASKRSVLGVANHESEENSEVPTGQGSSCGDYDYLQYLHVGVVHLEKLLELRGERDRRALELETIQKISAECLWKRDLDALEAKLIEELKQYERKLETERKSIEGGAYLRGPEKNTIPETDLLAQGEQRRRNRKRKATGESDTHWLFRRN